MNEFENKLIIKEENFQGGFFPKVPNFKKQGSAFILTGGSGDDIIVNEHTTSKEIRQGKYTKLVEISTRPYIQEIHFDSISKENTFSFDVYVKAVIQVNDILLFYQNRNLDIDTYFKNLFSLDARKITKRYSILNYEGMDEDLTDQLSSYATVDEATGFSYQISAVDAAPGEKAQQYVAQYNKQQLDANLKANARGLKGFYSFDYKEALMTEVAEGKISELEAIRKIKEFENMDFDNKIKHIDDLRGKGMLTDKDAKSYVSPTLEEIGIKKQTDIFPEDNSTTQIEMNEFYTEDEDE